MRKRIAHEQELWYEEELRKEIGKDWEAHGKKPLKKKDKNEPPSGGGIVDIEKEEDIPEGVKTQKCSATDPESGWFQKGEHKHVFACAVEKACDKHDWISGYRTPAIVHELPEDGIEPLFPYKRPMTRDGFYRKYEYVYYMMSIMTARAVEEYMEKAEDICHTLGNTPYAICMSKTFV